MMERILNVDSLNAELDESVTKFEYHTHLPYASTTYGNNDEIRIPVHQQSFYTLPSDSYLQIRGKVEKVLNNVSSYDGTIQLVPACSLLLFNEMRYEINGTEVDRSRNPGITSLMKNAVTLSHSQQYEAKSSGLGFGDTKFTPANSTGEFNVITPLKYIFGFFDDYKRILLNVKQELVLQRSSTDKNVVVTPLTFEGEVKVTISSIVWRIPYVDLSDEKKLPILRMLEQDQPINMAFRRWELYENPTVPSSKQFSWTIKSSSQAEKPRMIILGFQTGKKNNITQMMSQFDQCGVRNVRLYLNSVYFPYDSLQGDYAMAYKELSRANRVYNNRSSDQPLLSVDDFSRTLLHVIDCSNQNDSLKTGSVDVRLEIEADENIAANTTAYCLIIYDVLLNYTPLTGIVHRL
jgi:hypothetical protein